MIATTAGNAPTGRRIYLPRLGIVLLVTVGVLVVAMVALYWRAASRTNHVALSQSAKPVTTSKAAAAKFQHAREYVGITEPWVEAKVGPQYIAAYVGTVLFRPGATVKRDEVLATLDCRFAAAASRETAAQARSISERQAASHHEAQRVQEIASGGFASVNEVEQLRARAASEHAETESVRASLVTKNIEVHDCVLRAPFAGDVLARFVDPGAYVRPGDPVLTVADRSTIRVTGDAPEDDFAAVEPGTPVEISIGALKVKLNAPITRRTPGTDHATRTVHFEVDINDAEHKIPVGATALLRVPVGKPEPATELPSGAATLSQEKATVYVVENGVAHKKEVPVIGYRTGAFYVAPSALPAGTEVVVNGRSLLNDGDRVNAKASDGQ
jgi:RND family efflux transporter MFP subunit